MKVSLASFTNLPVPMKIGAFAFAGGGVLAIVAALAYQSSYLWLFMVGMVVVALLLVAYNAALKWHQKRQAARMDAGLATSARVKPRELTAPDAQARITDLQDKFTEGVQKFRDAGKSLYSVPWYLLVGESGSGKTEAIRHCQVGFPPGLQNTQQGVGGTINMNWWFTTHAVILDTAGRLMFEQIKPGSTNEWTEFLKLLRGHRPNSPINGILLVIPADSLIKDTPEEIEQKASRIAEQFDHIQRALGVRFPVWVMVTKCDLVSGFREFFEDISDPALQAQVLGWSKPGSLDDAFIPADVEDHLDVVRDRLVKRRLGLVLDPVHSENPNSRRINQVDALYDFPDNLMQIAPRLKRYLEMIFVAGEWSSKPLFLRGIYFTSAMREGEALDAALAQMLGTTVEALPEARSWERDRSFFLRDLFLKKVFRERGLVTRASHTGMLKRRRKIMLLGTGIGAAAVLILFSWFGASSLSRSIGDEGRFWTDVADVVIEDEPAIIVQRGAAEPEYHGKDELVLGSVTTTLEGLPALAQQLVTDKQVAVPWVFAPVRWFSSINTGGVNENRRRAAADLFEHIVFVPVVEHTERKLTAEKPGTWTIGSYEGLRALIQLHAAAGRNPMGDAGEAPLPDIAALFAYLYPPPPGEHGAATGRNPNGPSSHHLKDFPQAMQWAYDPNGADLPFPPTPIAEHKSAINHGVDAFIEHWVGKWKQKTDVLEVAGVSLFDRLLTLKLALEEFERYEDELLKLGDTSLSTPAKPSTAGEYQAIAGSWTQAYDKLKDAKDRSAHALDALKADVAALGGGPSATVETSIERLINKAREQELEAATQGFEALIVATGRKAPLPVGDAGAGAAGGEGAGGAGDKLDYLATVREKLDLGLKELRSTAATEFASLNQTLIQKKDDYLAASASAAGDPLFMIRWKMYEAAQNRFAAPPAPESVAQVAQTLGQLRRDAGSAKDTIRALTTDGRDKERVQRAAKLASAAVDQLATRHNRSAVFQSAIALLPANKAACEQVIAAMVADKQSGIQRVRKPVIALSGMAQSGQYFEDKHHPEAVARLMGVWDTLAHDVTPPDATTPADVLDAAALKQQLAKSVAVRADYLSAYLSYWVDTVGDEAGFHDDAFDAWAKLQAALGKVLLAGNIIQPQYELMRLQLQALRPSDFTITKDDLGALRFKQLEDQLALIDAQMKYLSADAELGKKFGVACEKSLNEWYDLGGDADQAAEKLRNETLRSFRQKYFTPVPTAEEEVGVPYWNDLMLHCLRLVADSQKDTIRKSWDLLVVKAKGFPLCRDCPRQLTEAELASALELVNKIKLPTGPAGTGQTVRDVGGEGATGNLKSHLDHLAGREILKPDEENLYRKLRKVSQIFDGVPALTVQIIIPETTVQDTKPQSVASHARAADHFAASFNVNDKTAGTMEPGSASPLADRYALPGSAIRFDFFRNKSDRDARRATDTIHWAGSWDLFAAMFRNGETEAVSTSTQRDPDAGSSVWKVLLEPDPKLEGKKVKCYYWVRLQFSRSVPATKDWPSEADWR